MQQANKLDGAIAKGTNSKASASGVPHNLIAQQNAPNNVPARPPDPASPAKLLPRVACHRTLPSERGIGISAAEQAPHCQRVLLGHDLNGVGERLNRQLVLAGLQLCLRPCKRFLQTNRVSVVLLVAAQVTREKQMTTQPADTHLVHWDAHVPQSRANVFLSRHFSQAVVHNSTAIPHGRQIAPHGRTAGAKPSAACPASSACRMNTPDPLRGGPESRQGDTPLLGCLPQGALIPPPPPRIPLPRQRTGLLAPLGCLHIDLSNFED